MARWSHCDSKSSAELGATQPAVAARARLATEPSESDSARHCDFQVATDRAVEGLRAGPLSAHHP
jgi:hypothetical protein